MALTEEQAKNPLYFDNSEAGAAQTARKTMHIPGMGLSRKKVGVVGVVIGVLASFGAMLGWRKMTKPNAEE